MSSTSIALDGYVHQFLFFALSHDIGSGEPSNSSNVHGVDEFGSSSGCS